MVAYGLARALLTNSTRATALEIACMREEVFSTATPPPSHLVSHPVHDEARRITRSSVHTKMKRPQQRIKSTSAMSILTPWSSASKQAYNPAFIITRDFYSNSNSGALSRPQLSELVCQALYCFPESDLFSWSLCERIAQTNGERPTYGARFFSEGMQDEEERKMFEALGFFFLNPSLCLVYF